MDRAGGAVADLSDVLTPRQRQMLEMAAEGMRDAQIAAALFVTRSTVKSTLRAVYKRLGVSGRTQASVVWLRAGEQGDQYVRVPVALWTGVVASLQDAESALPRQYGGYRRLRQVLAWVSRIEHSRLD